MTAFSLLKIQVMSYDSQRFRFYKPPGFGFSVVVITIGLVVAFIASRFGGAKGIIRQAPGRRRISSKAIDV